MASLLEDHLPPMEVERGGIRYIGPAGEDLSPLIFRVPKSRESVILRLWRRFKRRWLSRGGSEPLVASGGPCAPLTPRYDILFQTAALSEAELAELRHIWAEEQYDNEVHPYYGD